MRSFDGSENFQRQAYKEAQGVRDDNLEGEKYEAGGGCPALEEGSSNV